MVGGKHSRLVEAKDDEERRLGVPGMMGISLMVWVMAQFHCLQVSRTAAFS